jgi:hypothetical protein
MRWGKNSKKFIWSSRDKKDKLRKLIQVIEKELRQNFNIRSTDNVMLLKFRPFFLKFCQHIFDFGFQKIEFLQTTFPYNFCSQIHLFRPTVPSIKLSLSLSLCVCLYFFSFHFEVYVSFYASIVCVFSVRRGWGEKEKVREREREREREDR